MENRTDIPDPHPIDFSYSLIFNSPHYKMCSDLFTHSSEGHSEPELIKRGWGERVLLLERWQLQVFMSLQGFYQFLSYGSHIVPKRSHIHTNSSALDHLPPTSIPHPPYAPQQLSAFDPSTYVADIDSDVLLLD